MNNAASMQKSTIGIIGGGKAGFQFFSLFHSNPTTTVEYVVDLNLDAPALRAARKERIATYTDVERALSNHRVDFIFEVTGLESVARDLRGRMNGSESYLITHEISFLILRSLEYNTHQLQMEVAGEVSAIQTEITKSLESIDNMVDHIQGITEEMRMLALNAQIEAARAGEHGRGFGVVAQYMSGSVDSVREVSEQIETVNNNVRSVAERINHSLSKLN